jgi:hypothetical protein
MSSQPQPSTTISDLEMALLLQRKKHRLSKRSREFVDAMVGNLTRPTLSPGQQKYLHSLFRKLNEKVA